MAERSPSDPRSAKQTRCKGITKKGNKCKNSHKCCWHSQESPRDTKWYFVSPKLLIPKTKGRWVKRKEIPKNTTPIHFRFKDDPDFGMINLCGGKRKEYLKIKNYDKIVIKLDEINVYFPVFEQFYIKKYVSVGGFSLKDLFKVINHTGIDAGKHSKYGSDMKYHFASRGDFPCEYAITSSPKGSNINFNPKTGNVYISTQH